jgi:hypothetical protein
LNTFNKGSIGARAGFRHPKFELVQKSAPSSAGEPRADGLEHGWKIAMRPMRASHRASTPSHAADFSKRREPPGRAG